MARVKRGVTAHARHKKVVAMAKGYRGRNSRFNGFCLLRARANKLRRNVTTSGIDDRSSDKQSC